jgi:hypothetical protein
MKRTKMATSQARKEHLDRLCEELGADVVRKLSRAFRLTAAAVYKRAVEQAEAQLQETGK